MRILIAIDRTDFGVAIADFVGKHSWAPGSQFKILHVVPPDTPDQYSIDDYQKSQADHLLDRLRAQLKGIGDYEIIKEITLGNPTEQIINAAKKWDAQLIIVGSHGRDRSSQYAMGSVAERVVSSESCSVMVIRLPDADTTRQGAMLADERVPQSRDAVTLTAR